MKKHLIAGITALGCALIIVSCISANQASNETPASVKSQLAAGAPIYIQTCATGACHGTQGEGLRSKDGFSVWPLVGEEFQSRHPNAQIAFDVVRSGSEPSLLTLTDQQIYDVIAYELSQNQITLKSPLTADNAFTTHGGSMSGRSQGGLYPPSGNAVLINPPLIRSLPIAARNDKLRLQVDQATQASTIGSAKGTFLILVILFDDLTDQPITISPDHLKLHTPGGEVLKAQPVDIQSAIEQFHVSTIQPQHGTVGLIVFKLTAPNQFDELIYEEETGIPLTLALKP